MSATHISVAGRAVSLLTGYPREACVHHVFGAIAQNEPNSLAIVTDNKSITYAEIDAVSNQLARRLSRLGVVPGSIVAFLTKRSANSIIGWLAALKCGATYMPLDPTYPLKSLEFIVADAKPTLILAQNEFFNIAEAISTGEVFKLEDELRNSSAEPPEVLPVPCQATDRAYILYTSGSTGRPKGVQVAHRGVIRLVRNQFCINLSSADIQLFTSALGFDFATHNVWGSLLNGGRLAIVEGQHLSLDQIAYAIEKFSITTIGLSTAVFHLFVEQRLESLRPLKQIVVGGDILSVEHAKRMLEHLPQCRLINGYGPTENTTFTTFYDVPSSGWGTGPIPIGRAIEHTTVYILDELGQPVPLGETGFLWTGGDGVALGYLNRPELTAERFVPDPFASEPDALMYATGDLARVRPDGEIEFLGRKDRQVKISGKRIELDEIEMVLRQDYATDDAIVMLQSLGGDDKRIVAFVKPVYGTDSTNHLDSLRTRIADRLPDYMMPSAIRIVDTFPMTPNGKVDREALLNESASPLVRTTDIVLPADELERQLAQIWQTALKLDMVGRNENFFDLGGKSLHLMRIHAELKKEIAPHIDIVQLFRNPTIAGLANFLRKGSRENKLEVLTHQRAERQRAALKRARRTPKD